MTQVQVPVQMRGCTRSLHHAMTLVEILAVVVILATVEVVIHSHAIAIRSLTSLFVCLMKKETSSYLKVPVWLSALVLL